MLREMTAMWTTQELSRFSRPCDRLRAGQASRSCGSVLVRPVARRAAKALRLSSTRASLLCVPLLTSAGCHAESQPAQDPEGSASAQDQAALQRQRDAAERMRKRLNPDPPEALFRIAGTQAIPIYCEETSTEHVGRDSCSDYMAAGIQLGVHQDLALPIEHVEIGTCTDLQGQPLAVAILGAAIPGGTQFASAPPQSARPDWGIGASPLLSVFSTEELVAARAALSRALPEAEGKSWTIMSEWFWGGRDSPVGALATVWQPDLHASAVLLFSELEHPSVETARVPSVVLIEKDVKLAIIETLSVGTRSPQDALVIEGVHEGQAGAGPDARARSTRVFVFEGNQAQRRLKVIGGATCVMPASSGEFVAGPTLQEAL